MVLLEVDNTAAPSADPHEHTRQGKLRQHKRCATYRPIIIAFGSALLIGFFIMGPLTKHALASSKSTKHSNAQILGNLFVPNFARPLPRPTHPVATNPNHLVHGTEYRSELEVIQGEAQKLKERETGDDSKMMFTHSRDPTEKIEATNKQGLLDYGLYYGVLCVLNVLGTLAVWRLDFSSTRTSLLHSVPGPVSVRTSAITMVQPNGTSTDNGSDDKAFAATSMQESKGPFVNSQVLRQLIFNQIVLGFPIWTGGFGAGLLKLAQFDSLGFWIIGILGAFPLVYLGNFIEKSESGLFTDLNLSTKLTVLRLLGTKTEPLFAFGVCAGLSLLTGVVEEVAFRGGVLASISQWAVDNGFAETLQGAEPIGLVLSSLAFALGHISPVASIDTLVLFCLQTVTGFTFGLLYVLTGNPTSSIIAHFLYDLYTLYETHLSATNQISYAATASSPPNIQQKWLGLMGEDFVKEARQAYFMMDTNRDGKITPGELRMGLYSMGLKVNEPELQSAFEDIDTDGSGDVDLNEFFDYVSKSQGNATDAAKRLKFSLLGVRI